MTRSVFAAFLSFGLVLPARSAPPAASLADVLEQARQRNPEIQAARSEWERAEAAVLPAKTWEPPQIGYESWGFTGANVGAAPEKWYDLSQDIPFPGKLRLKGRAARHAARRQEELFQATELDVLAKVRAAYYRLMLSQRALQIVNENVDVMRRFAKVAESKYSVGKVSQADALRAQVELVKMLNMSVMIQQENETNQAALNALLDKDAEAAVGLAQEPPLAPLAYAYDELSRIALAERPEVHAAAHHVDHMRANLASSRSDYLPDFMVQYTRRTRVGMPNDSVGMVKMTLPFLYFWRQRSEVKGARLELDHAQAMKRSAEAETRADIKEYFAKVQTTRRLIDLYKTSVLPQSEQAVKVSESAYQTDRVGFLDLLDSQRALLDFRLEYFQTLAQYGQNLAELERRVGRDLFAPAGPRMEERHE